MRAKFDFNGTTNLPAIEHFRSDGREAVGRPLTERAHYQSVVSVNHNRYHYGYNFDPSVFVSRSLDLSIEFAHNNDTVVMELRNLPGNASIRNGGYTSAVSLDALKQGEGRQYFRNGQSLFVKMRANGSQWAAKDAVSIKW